MYFLEIVEEGCRIPAGKPTGYATLAEAEAAAERHVDDALPRNTVRVLQLVSVAYFGGDGESYIRKP